MRSERTRDRGLWCLVGRCLRVGCALVLGWGVFVSGLVVADEGGVVAQELDVVAQESGTVADESVDVGDGEVGLASSDVGLDDAVFEWGLDDAGEGSGEGVRVVEGRLDKALSFDGDGFLDLDVDLDELDTGFLECRSGVAEAGQSESEGGSNAGSGENTGSGTSETAQPTSGVSEVAESVEPEEVEPEDECGWSVGVWVNRHAVGVGGSVLLGSLDGEAGGLLLEGPFSGRVGVGVLGGQVWDFGYGTPLGEWVHLVFVGSRVGVSLFANGVLVGWLDGGLDLPLGRLGAGSNGGGVRAVLDDLRVYDRALSSDEIAGLFEFFPHELSVPGVVRGLSGVDRDGAVGLSWLPPETDGRAGMSGYEVRWREAGGGVWAGVVDVGVPSEGEVLGYEVSGLLDGVMYEFQVRAVNRVGGGGWLSMPFVAGVLGVSDPVRGLRVRPELGGFVVSWDLPGDTGGFDVSGYEVRYRGVGSVYGRSGGWQSEFVSASERGLLVDELLDGRVYEVQVRALTGFGAGFWASERVLVGRLGPPGAPRGLAAEVRQDSALLFWGAPGVDGGDEVDGYEVRYKRGAFWSEPVVLQSWVQGYEFSGLVRGVNHVLMVRAINAHGAGSWAGYEIDFGLSGEQGFAIPRLVGWLPGEENSFEVSRRSRIVLGNVDANKNWADDFSSVVLGDDQASVLEDLDGALDWDHLHLVHPQAVGVVTSKARSLKQVADKLASDLELAVGFELPVVLLGDTANVRSGDILVDILDTANPELSVEGYELTVGDTVTVSANTSTGVFYGSRSLLQLLAASADGLSASAGSVTHSPSSRSAVRSLHLDLASRSYNPAHLHHLIRLLSWYKLNVLHLDFTNANGNGNGHNGNGNGNGSNGLLAGLGALEEFANLYHVGLVVDLPLPEVSASQNEQASDAPSGGVVQSAVNLVSAQWFRPTVRQVAQARQVSPVGQVPLGSVWSTTRNPLQTTNQQQTLGGGVRSLPVSTDRWVNGHHLVVGRQLQLPDVVAIHTQEPTYNGAPEVGAGLFVSGSLVLASTDQFISHHLHRPLVTFGDRMWNEQVSSWPVTDFLAAAEVLGLPPSVAPNDLFQPNRRLIHHWSFDNAQQYITPDRPASETQQPSDLQGLSDGGVSGSGYLRAPDRVGGADGYVLGSAQQFPKIVSDHRVSGRSLEFGHTPLATNKDGIELGVVDLPAPWTLSVSVKRNAEHPGATLLNSPTGALRIEQYDSGAIGFTDRRGTTHEHHMFDYELPIGR
ncbi:MAG: fibronectin type III domain-containing protein [bacterium]|nr:fibronectin type III domain-containing protein [bacterium]